MIDFFYKKKSVAAITTANSRNTRKCALLYRLANACRAATRTHFAENCRNINTFNYF